jgi:hypothetical protein
MLALGVKRPRCHPPLVVRSVLFATAAAAWAAVSGYEIVGVLCLGCHLQAKGWHDVMWGREDKLGRLPHAVRLAIAENASMFVIGGGVASSREGLTEGRYTEEFLKQNWDKLRSFSQFRDIDLAKARADLEPQFESSLLSVNTAEEVMEAGRLFHARGCQKVIIVSSPTHISRCIRDACVGWNFGDHWSPVLLASPCETNFPGCSAKDVTIIEPEHRGDRDHALDSLPLHILAQRLLKVDRRSRLDFHRKLDALLARYHA